MEIQEVSLKKEKIQRIEWNIFFLTKIKNSLDELSSRMEMTEKRLYELKDTSTEIIWF